MPLELRWARGSGWGPHLDKCPDHEILISIISSIKAFILTASTGNATPFHQLTLPSLGPSELSPSLDPRFPPPQPHRRRLLSTCSYVGFKAEWLLFLFVWGNGNQETHSSLRWILYYIIGLAWEQIRENLEQLGFPFFPETHNLHDI